jgi:hypothetical protein
MGKRRKPLAVERAGMNRSRISILLLLLLAAELRAGQADRKPVDLHRLDEARQWFRQNPPDGKNRGERRKMMAAIQQACDQLDYKEYVRYTHAWGKDDDLADSLERRHPALHYLRQATLDAFQDCRRTSVKRGVAIWLLYNMGYLVKTPDAFFGIDIKCRESERLAGQLDFLLITHGHSDHYDKPLVEAMLKARKPVVTRWYPGSTIVSKPREFRFGSVRVKVDIGDHHHRDKDGRNDMLMYQVDCGAAASDLTIYHSGGGSNYKKIRPDKKVDMFIPHVSVGMSVPGAIRHVKPRLTLVSHILELAHKRGRWRWSFDAAFQKIGRIPPDQATTLTWGERIVTPGTELNRASE